MLGALLYLPSNIKTYYEYVAQQSWNYSAWYVSGNNTVMWKLKADDSLIKNTPLIGKEQKPVPDIFIWLAHAWNLFKNAII